MAGVLLMTTGIGLVAFATTLPAVFLLLACFYLGIVIAEPARETLMTKLAQPGARGSYMGFSRLGLALGGMTGYVGAVPCTTTPWPRGNPGCPGWCSAPSVSPPCCCWPTASSAAPAWQGSTPDPLAIIPSTPGALLLKGALFHLHLALPSPRLRPSTRKSPIKKRQIALPLLPSPLGCYLLISNMLFCNMKSITWLAVVPEPPVRVSKVWFISTIS